MVDSIVFKIHDLRVHEPLVKFLHQRGGLGQSKFSKTLEVEERDFIKRSYVHKYWTDFVTGNTIETAHRSHLPSHHYNTAYCIDFEKDFIEFNFSIPKYLYGTNVFQFVPHYFDKDYSRVYDTTISTRGFLSWERLRRFLKYFFVKELGDCVDDRLVQISRIDLAFNKIFRNKTEALTYVADLQRFKKKFFRENSTRITNYMQGFYFPTKDYTFKIYHKGTEFAKHDRQKLLTVLRPDQIELIQDGADKMIRYEVEYRPGIMNRLYQRKIFRRLLPRWKKAVRYFEQFQRTKSYIIQIVQDENGKIIRLKKYRTPPMQDENGNDYTKKEINEMKMSQTQWALVKYGKFYYNKTFSFFLESDSRLGKSDELWEAEIGGGGFTWEPNQKFSHRLFDQMVKFFLVQLREFSVGYDDDLKAVIDKVDMHSKKSNDQNIFLRDKIRSMIDFNESEVKLISIGQLKQVLALLRDNSFSEIKRLGIMKERTFYRYKKLLEKFGFKDFTASQYIPLSDDTFATYFLWVDSVAAKLSIENLFRSKF